MIKNVSLEYIFGMDRRSICFYGNYCPTIEENKFKVFDSDNKYLGYLECDTEEKADKIAQDLDTFESVNALLCYLGILAKVSQNTNDIHSYMFDNDYEGVTRDISSIYRSPYLNRLGKYYIAIVEDKERIEE